MFISTQGTIGGHGLKIAVPCPLR